MNITDEARKEALEWLETSVVDCRGNWDSKNCKDSCPSGHCKDMVELLRSALEPQTVTREFITMLERIAEDCIIGDEEGFIDSMEFLSRTMGLLQQAGIEITGTSPDNISKEVNNGS